ncbi:MAG TPA: porin [Planctomycetota bacterium]|nr:porin [Planctomycetota bacterium]
MTQRLLLSLLVFPLALLFAASPAARAQQDDGNSVDEAILDVLLERGIIDQAQYEELLAMAKAKRDADANEIALIEGRLARLNAPDVQVQGGQPGKLAFKSPDGKWSAELRGFIQARFTNTNAEADGQSGNNFSVPRARMILSGISGAPNVKYKLEIDASTKTGLDTDVDTTEPSEQQDAIVKDAYVDYGVTDSGSVRFGQYKFPFGREELISDSSDDLVDKSLANRTFAPAREPGASWQGKALDGVLEYELAASNGDGQNEPNSADSSALDVGDGLRYGARAVWYPLGEMKYDFPSFQTLDGGSKLSLGVAYMSNKDARLLNTVVAGTNGTDANTLDLELQWMTGPFSLLAELYDRSTIVPGSADGDDNGYTVQAGFFVVPRVWELVARLSMVDQTDLPPGFVSGTPSRQQETTIGIDRYIDGHNGKWMFDFVDTDNETVSDQDSQQVRLQYQVMF